MVRKLATHRTIDQIKEHPNADAIEIAVIDGWQCIVKKDEFAVGDSCLYLEIDSFLPADDPRFAFLTKSGVKKDVSGRERIRLRTVRLRGEMSQGLALPWSMFPELHDLDDVETVDLAEMINIIKYERPEPKTTDAVGSFPWCIPKTDAERIQNLWGTWKDIHRDTMFVPTLKLDGSSCTVALFDSDFSDFWKTEGPDDTRNGIRIEDNQQIQTGEITVCSRNLRLKNDIQSHFWTAAFGGALDALKVHHENGGSSIAIQGEVIGPGIQKNNEKLTNFQFRVFDIYDIARQRYYPWYEVVNFCLEHDLYNVGIVEGALLPFQEFDTIEELLAFSDGPSLTRDVRREGIVWKSIGLKNNEIVQFKAISNEWLLSGND